MQFAYKFTFILITNSIEIFLWQYIISRLNVFIIYYLILNFNIRI